MHFGAARALVLETNLAVHGFDVVVTRPAPEDTPIATRGMWLTSQTEAMPLSTDFQRRDPIRVLALSRLAVPTVPRGTVILAPPKAGDDDQTWRVDGMAQEDPDKWHVTVLPDEADPS